MLFGKSINNIFRKKNNRELLFVILSLFVAVIIFIFKLSILYKIATYQCSNKDLRSTSECILCQYEFINKIDSKSANQFLKIRDDCYENSENQYEISVCVDKKIMGGKYVKIK